MSDSATHECKPFPVHENVAGDGKTMKAAVIYEYGESDKIVYGDVPLQKPAPGQVLIKIHAASVNPVDWKARKGFLKGMMPTFGGRPSTGVILGWDGAGVIESVGFGVYMFKPGDKVFFRPENEDWGCYAQYCIAGVHTVAHMPTNLTFEEAAAVPLAGITAFQALFTEGGLKAGEKVLIHAGSGGVGHLAVQMAAAKGAIVTATCSAANADYCKKLGASTVIDYKTEDYTQKVADMDLVFNTVNADTANGSIACLKNGGRMTSISGGADAEKCREKCITAKGLFMIPNGQHLAEIGAMIEAGQVKPTVAATFPLSEAAAAQDHQQKGGFCGKVVMTVAHS